MYGLQLRIKFLEKYVQSVTMQIESFEQVHLAPKRYVQLLGEAFRRRLFSTNYMKVILKIGITILIAFCQFVMKFCS